jgi:hypothetical protein
VALYYVLQAEHLRRVPIAELADEALCPFSFDEEDKREICFDVRARLMGLGINSWGRSSHTIHPSRLQLALRTTLLAAYRSSDEHTSHSQTSPRLPPEIWEAVFQHFCCGDFFI